ncbi:O-antigen export protein [soil metagenome]
MSDFRFPKSLSNYFNVGNQRTLRTTINVALSFAVKGLSIVINLALVPLTINYISSNQYGIWLTLSSIIGWLLFFDVGFGNGLRNRFAESVAKHEFLEARIYVSTTYVTVTCIVVVLFLLFCCINPFLNWSAILNAPDVLSGELSMLALVVFSFFCIQYILQLLSTILTANQQPAKASLFNFLGGFLSLIIIFILTKTTHGNLVYLGFALGASPIVVLTIASIWLFTHEYGRYSPSLKLFRLSSVKSLMSLGIQFFVLQIVWIVVFASGNIIVAQLFGPAEVTSYNIAFRYFSVVTMVFNIFSAPYWSAFTEAFVKADIEWIQKSTGFLIKIWLVLSLGTIVMMIFSNFVYKLWIGERVNIPISLSILMGIFTMISNWNSIFVNLLNGIGRIRLQMYIAIILGVINIPMSIFLGIHIGIEGVIMSSCICLLFGSILTPIQHRKLLRGTATGIWAK